LAELKENRGDAIASKQALESAREGLMLRLKKEPLEKVTRLQLALVLIKLQRFAEAEGVLRSGLQLHRDVDMQRALMDFFLSRFDQLDNGLVVQRLGWLIQAMTVDLNSREIYVRFARVFNADLPLDQRDEIRRVLEELLVSGANASVAHFGLGILSLLDAGSEAQATRHLKQAITLQPAIAIACNNYAVLLLQNAPPRLDEALVVSRQIVASNPDIPLFRETLGTVLMERGEWEDAISELRAALPNLKDPSVVHAKLVRAYDALGRSTEGDEFRITSKSQESVGSGTGKRDSKSSSEK
jgi:tetratricopeptide (TPR) repeat protein